MPKGKGIWKRGRHEGKNFQRAYPSKFDLLKRTNIRLFLNSHGFLLQKAFIPEFEKTVIALLVSAMRNCRALDKWNNRRKTVLIRDLVDFDVTELTLIKNQRDDKARKERGEPKTYQAAKKRGIKFERTGEYSWLSPNSSTSKPAVPGVPHRNSNNRRKGLARLKAETEQVDTFKVDKPITAPTPHAPIPPKVDILPPKPPTF